jgi:hypothetical protein
MENIDTKALLGQIKKIEIRTNRAVDEIFGGAWRSVFRGRGIEFDEVREYADGDDVRDIDWSVTARTGKPFVKKYVEERELSVVLLVDASASQHYGSGGRSKLARSAECAAMLALSAVRNHDKVGLALFTDRIERWISVAGGRKHSLRLVRELLGFRPSSGRTDIANALRELCSIQRRRAIVFLFSDMLGSMTEYGHDLKLAAARHDIVCVRIHDPGEENAPSGAGALFADPETVSAASMIGCKNIVPVQKQSENELFVSEWGIRMTMTKPLPPETTHIGIKAHHFGNNKDYVFPVNYCGGMEDTFEHIIRFRFDKQKQGSADIWWKLPYAQTPETLPDKIGFNEKDILLLHQEVKEC